MTMTVHISNFNASATVSFQLTWSEFLSPAESSGPARVGDGGASWRLKALARAKAQSGDASDPNFGRKVGDIVSEQWGSLAELTGGLSTSRAAHGTFTANCCCQSVCHQLSLTDLHMQHRVGCFGSWINDCRNQE